MGLENGLSRSELQRQLKRGKNAIQTWSDRYEKEGDMKRSGPPKLTNPSDDRFLLIQCKKNRKRTAVDLNREIKGKDGKPKVSVWTTRRRLVEGGYPARKALKKPLLKKYHKRDRLRWAKDHKNWTVEQWNKVLWSDESSFTLFPRGEYLCKETARRRVEGCFHYPKKGGGKINVWGCFHASGVGILKRITE